MADQARDREAGLLEAPGARLYYEVAGKGHPLVLIHAGVADSSMWDDQFDVFASRYRAIRYDTRGFGKSLTEEVPFSDRQDLYDLLKHIGVDKTYVIGVSRGGQIATDFTLEHPEMVTALIPVAAGLGGFEGQPTPEEIEWWQKMEQAWTDRDFEAEAEIDVRVWADGPAQPAGRAPEHVREKVRRMCLLNYDADHKSQGQPTVLEPPAVGRLGEIHVPTLVIVGELDATPVLQAADVMAEGIPGARKAVIQGVAHMIPMEKPEEFSRLVLDFLDSVQKS